MRLSRLLPPAILLALAASLLPVSPAPAVVMTFNVTKTADTVDGVCDADCSLREAILAASDNPGTDTVVVPVGTYTVTIPGLDDDGISGDFDLFDPVTIEGAGAAQTIINGGALDRVFQTFCACSYAIKGVTITNGAAVVFGGGSGFTGGGVLHSAGILTIQNSVISGNTANAGGGVEADAPTQIFRSTISGNSVQDLAFTNAYGGGIHLGGVGTLDLEQSTVTANSGSGFAGIMAENVASVTIQNSTIAQNAGNGMYAQNTDTDISDTTITKNDGTGIGLFACCGATFAISTSIVAGNAGGGDDCSSAPTSSGGFNVGDDASCSFTQPTDQQVTDPMLAAGLASNGGPTQTVALLAGSPVIDDGGACTGVDQRNVPQPQGSGCEPGAYEFARCGTTLVNRVGTLGDDLIRGTAGKDGILGLDGLDVLKGGAGNDFLCGGPDDDTLRGGTGKDHLYGDAGADFCDGGPDADSAISCTTVKSIP